MSVMNQEQEKKNFSKKKIFFFLFVILVIFSLVGILYPPEKKVSEPSLKVANAVVTASSTESADEICYKQFYQGTTTSPCLSQLPWIEHASSTKGSLTATVSYYALPNDIFSGLMRTQIVDGEKVIKISYEKVSAAMFSLEEELPKIYDFGKEYIVYQRLSEDVSYYDFKNESRAVSLFEDENRVPLIYAKTSSTSIDFYNLSEKGFEVKKTYVLPKEMEQTGYGLGSLCTGDPCSNNRLLIRSYNGSYVVINTHRFTDVSYTCPLNLQGEIGTSLSNFKEYQKCKEDSVLPNGERVISTDMYGMAVKKVDSDTQKQIKRVITGALVEGGLTLPLK